MHMLPLVWPWPANQLTQLVDEFTLVICANKQRLQARMACATTGPIPQACATSMAFILLIWSFSCACWHWNLVAAQMHTPAADDPALQLLSEQRSILATFKDHVDMDRNGALASWTASRDVCNWTGVVCAPSGPGRRVIALELPRRGLGGTITPLLFNLRTLTHLNLSDNSFRGSFPDVDQAGNGSTGESLVSLDLSGNYLSGVLPTSIGTLSKLQTLWLEGNDFWGSIPSTLGRCNKLVDLRLGTASDLLSPGRLNGTIPDALANCSSLALLILSHSELTGPIPEWLGSSFAKLQILNLASNQLTGTIPSSLGNLTSLSYLDLSQNQGLLGEVPVQLGSCNKLVWLTLGMSSPALDGRNGFNGTLATLYDKVLSNMTFLEHLVISGTQITGAIPQDFAMSKSLVNLGLWGNFLDGEIPPTLCNLTNIEYVDVSYNDFEGSIPREFGLCTSLREFKVGGSSTLGLARLLDPGSGATSGTSVRNVRMTGSIPAEMGNLPFLTDFSVFLTNIDGNIPDFSNATSLTYVTLYSNNLEGIFTTEHMPTSLQTLMLAVNQLTGPIPPSISNLSSLFAVSMEYNDFEDSIPREFALCTKLRLLSLGGSSISSGPGRSMITGSIPRELGQLAQLEKLNFISTQLTGTIPSSLGNCTSINSFVVSDHELYGGLPTWLSNFTSLQVLDVSTNKLNGSLSVVDWSKLQRLSVLFLSKNRFSGYLSSSLGMLKGLSVFVASETNLTGTLPLSLKNNSNLDVVDFQSNALSGNISSVLDILADTAEGRSIRVIMLSSNMFYGHLPNWTSVRFKRLQILLLGGNSIEGPIPSTLSHNVMSKLEQGLDDDPGYVIFRIVNRLTSPIVKLTLNNRTESLFGIPQGYSILDVSNNHLEGGIPAELSQLVGLRYLNLSRNHLTGSIPSTFSNLTSLLQLDVSNNNLSGTIPSTLASLDQLGYVDFSSNRLMGPIPSGMLTKYPYASYLGNPGLCSEILNVSCATPPSPSPSNEGLEPSSGPGAGTLVSWAGFGIGFSVSFLVALGLFVCTKRGLTFILGDTQPSVYIIEHGFFKPPG